ncbi:MAG: AMP-binding protein [Chlamydiota bacterium]
MRTLSDHLQEAFRAYSHKSALKTVRGTYTYAQLGEKVELYKKQLSSLRDPKLPIFTLDAPVCPETIALLLACVHEEVTLFLLNRYLPPFFIKKQLDKLPVSHIVTEGSLKNSTSIRERFLRIERDAPPPSGELLKQNPLTLLLTSGTTSAPKLAAHSSDNHLYSALASQTEIPLEPGDTWLLSMPLYHVAGIGIIFRALLQGAALCLPSAIDALKSVTHCSFVATTLRRFLQAPYTENLKCGFVGGGPIPPSLEIACKERSLPMLYTYGLTEMSSHVCSTRYLLREGGGVCFGKAHENARVQIEGEELYVQGKTRFLGYYPKSLPPEVWFPTKDTAKIDEQGRIWIFGRKDRQFISGGENIQPAEIEKALESLPGVQSAKVLPRPDPEYGMRPIAVVRATDFNEEAIKKSLRKILSSYKIPDQIFLENGSISSLQGKFY